MPLLRSLIFDVVRTSINMALLRSCGESKNGPATEDVNDVRTIVPAEKAASRPHSKRFANAMRFQFSRQCLDCGLPPFFLRCIQGSYSQLAGRDGGAPRPCVTLGGMPCPIRCGL